jgi:hypothetical protein
MRIRLVAVAGKVEWKFNGSFRIFFEILYWMLRKVFWRIFKYFWFTWDYMRDFLNSSIFAIESAIFGTPICSSLCRIDIPKLPADFPSIFLEIYWKNQKFDQLNVYLSKSVKNLTAEAASFKKPTRTHLNAAWNFFPRVVSCTCFWAVEDFIPRLF